MAQFVGQEMLEKMREGRTFPSLNLMRALDGTAAASTGGAISEKVSIEDDESRKLAFMA